MKIDIDTDALQTERDVLVERTEAIDDLMASVAKYKALPTPPGTREKAAPPNKGQKVPKTATCPVCGKTGLPVEGPGRPGSYQHTSSGRHQEALAMTQGGESQ